MKSINQVYELLIYTRLRGETVMYVSPCAVSPTPGPPSLIITYVLFGKIGLLSTPLIPSIAFIEVAKSVPILWHAKHESVDFLRLFLC